MREQDYVVVCVVLYHDYCTGFEANRPPVFALIYDLDISIQIGMHLLLFYSQTISKWLIREDE